MLEKYFCSYEQAVALKELGFDEECLVTYHKELHTIIPIYGLFTNQDVLKAPLKSQAFDFLYSKTGKWIVPIPNDDKKGEWYGFGVSYKTYEEAENACLNTLLEFAKIQNNDKA